VGLGGIINFAGPGTARAYGSLRRGRGASTGTGTGTGTGTDTSASTGGAQIRGHTWQLDYGRTGRF